MGFWIVLPPKIIANQITPAPTEIEGIINLLDQKDFTPRVIIWLKMCKLSIVFDRVWCGAVMREIIADKSILSSHKGMDEQGHG